MCERFDLKSLFLGKLRPERLTSNQMVSQLEFFGCELSRFSHLRDIHFVKFCFKHRFRIINFRTTSHICLNMY